MEVLKTFRCSGLYKEKGDKLTLKDIEWLKKQNFTKKVRKKKITDNAFDQLVREGCLPGETKSEPVVENIPRLNPVN